MYKYRLLMCSSRTSKVIDYRGGKHRMPIFRSWLVAPCREKPCVFFTRQVSDLCSLAPSFACQAEILFWAHTPCSAVAGGQPPTIRLNMTSYTVELLKARDQKAGCDHCNPVQWITRRASFISTVFSQFETSWSHAVSQTYSVYQPAVNLTLQ